MAGRYAYGDEPGDVYGRHDNCSCTVTYESGRQRQDVWSKRSWEAPAADAGADAPTVFTEETRPQGAGEPVRLSKAQAAAAQARHPLISFMPGQAESLQNGLTSDEKRATMETENQRLLRIEIDAGRLPLIINPDKQARHVLSEGETKKPDGRSYLTIDLETAQAIINQYAATGDVSYIPSSYRFKELIETNIVLGIDGKSGEPTTQAFILYSKTGTHLVPTKRGRSKHA